MAPHCMTAHWESATLKILSYTHKTGSRNTPKEPVPCAEGDLQGGPASQSVLCKIRIISLLSNMNPQRESMPTVPCPFHIKRHLITGEMEPRQVCSKKPYLASLILRVSIYPHFATTFSFVVCFSIIYRHLLKWYISSYICCLLPHFCGTCIKIIKLCKYLVGDLKGSGRASVSMWTSSTYPEEGPRACGRNCLEMNCISYLMEPMPLTGCLLGLLPPVCMPKT